MDNSTTSSHNDGHNDGDRGPGDDVGPVEGGDSSEGVVARGPEGSAGTPRVVRCTDEEGQESTVVVEVTKDGLVLDSHGRAVLRRLDDVESLTEAVTEAHLELLARHATNEPNPHRARRRRGPRPHRSSQQAGDERPSAQERPADEL